jgi:twitching motility protein PilT
MDINQLFELTLKNRASDLHLVVGVTPTLRINGALQPLTGQGVINSENCWELINQVLTEEQQREFKEKKELDFSYQVEGGARFRTNVYFAKGEPAAAFRAIPNKIATLEELNLPAILHDFTQLNQGFILITGPTGHGKSTTVASILDEINQTRGVHIVSIEDPIEYVLTPDKALISQREIGSDSLDWQMALRSCLREDPDVVFVGEMRDLESIAMALTIAETGHLVFSTLHTNSAAQTIERLVDVFPEGSKQQIRYQLANTLKAVVAQRLVPTLDEGRVPAVEILLANQAVETSIRENKIHMIDNVIQTSLEMGMMPLERSLASWVQKGKISPEIAKSYSLRPEELNRQLRQKS